MIRRSTWILLGLFVVLVGVAWYMQGNKANQPPSPTPTTVSKALFNNIDEKSIASVRLQDAKGKAVVLGRDTAGLWTITEPQGGPADTGKIESGISALVGLQTTSSLNPTNDLNIYGLVNSAYRITITMNGGQADTLVVGDVTPTGDGYYVRLNQTPAQVVSKMSVDSVLDMLINPPFKPTETPTGMPGTESPTTTGTPQP